MVLYVVVNINNKKTTKKYNLYGPIFFGSQPRQQETVLSGLRSGKISRLSWLEKERLVDVFDAKRDVVQRLSEAGFRTFEITLTTPDAI